MNNIHQTKNYPVRLGIIQQKIILLLLAGLALSLTQSPRKQWHVLFHELPKEWRTLNRQALNRSLNALRDSHLVTFKQKNTKHAFVSLTSLGRKRANILSLKAVRSLKQGEWDGTWYMVMFDIKEDKKKKRDAFRYYLHKLNFYEYQKSVFVTPYKCRDEIEYLKSVWDVTDGVNLIEVKKSDDEDRVKRHFNMR
jgi:CRISPR-associated endonuclease Cas2